MSILSRNRHHAHDKIFKELKIIPQTWEISLDLIENFISDCRARGLTPHSIETYKSNVKSFLHACKDPCTVHIEDLRTFLNNLRDRGLSGSTLKGYFAALSAFYDYLVFEGIIQNNPVISFKKRYLSRIKDQHNTRQLISIQEMQLLIKAAKSIREKAILMTLAKTGMRRGELLSLQVEDINLKNSTITIPAKAKRTNRLTFMDDELKGVLLEYLSWRVFRAKSSWLWITKHGGRIHKDYPGKIIAMMGAALGLHDPAGLLCSRLTPHCFRHWLTTHLFRNGMNPEYIKWLRGDSLKKDAWEIYNHIDIEEVRQEYMRCIPKLIEGLAAPKNIS